MGDPEFMEYTRKNGLIKDRVRDFKKNHLMAWCNMRFGVDAWDMEDEELTAQNWDSPYRIWLCFRREEDATLFALRWS